MGSQNPSEESLAGLTEEILRTEIEARKLHCDVKNVPKALSDLEKCDRRITLNFKKSLLCGVGKVSDVQIRNSVMTWQTPADQVKKLDKTCPLRLDIKRKPSCRSDPVKSMDLYPTESWMLANFYSGQVHIWNYETQVVMKTFEVFDLPIRCVKFMTRKTLKP